MAWKTELWKARISSANEPPYDLEYCFAKVVCPSRQGVAYLFLVSAAKANANEVSLCMCMPGMSQLPATHRTARVFTLIPDLVMIICDQGRLSKEMWYRFRTYCCEP